MSSKLILSDSLENMNQTQTQLLKKDFETELGLCTMESYFDLLIKI